MKTIDDAARFLKDNGLLFEINRKVLHPLGLALSVECEQHPDGTTEVFGFGPLLNSENAEMVFEEDQFVSASARFEEFQRRFGADEKAVARMERFGFVEQDKGFVA